MTACAFPGCDRPIRSRGYCRPHYRRLIAYGDPDGAPPKNRRAGTGHYLARGYVLLHQWIAEKAIGKPLREGIEVHHVDYNPSNNSKSNLVVCPDAAYHDLLHQRTDALNACGHADWRKCRLCKRYDDPANLYISKTNVHHNRCMAAYYKNRRQNKP